MIDTPVFKNDKTLRSLLQQGDIKAFGQVYDNYSPLLFGFINRVINDHKRSADLLSVSFICIWQNRLSYDTPQESFFSWMINLVRPLILSATEKEANSTSERLCEEIVAINNLQITNVIQVTDKSAQNILELMFVYGKTSQEISLMLGLPEIIIMEHVRCALNRLKATKGNE